MTTYSKLLQDPRWQKKRAKILKRDKWTCLYCELKDKPLHVHHYFYNDDGPWETRDEHLITLCADCHKELQEGQRHSKEEFLRMILSEKITPHDLFDFAVFLHESGAIKEFLKLASRWRKTKKCKEYVIKYGHDFLRRSRKSPDPCFIIDCFKSKKDG